MDPTTPESFERAIGELEQIVQRMESGSLSLEESLGAYRRGASLVAWCRSSLADVQQQVRILEADLLEPFEANAEPLKATAEPLKANAEPVGAGAEPRDPADLLSSEPRGQRSPPAGR